jgi:hypothetical protein
VRHTYLESVALQILILDEEPKKRKIRRANFVSVIQVPYFDDTRMNGVRTALQGFIHEVDTRPKVTPVS